MASVLWDAYLILFMHYLEESQANTKRHNIYKNATINVKLHNYTNNLKEERGVRQRDTMSPKILTAVLEEAFKKLEQSENGILIDGDRPNNLCFLELAI